MKPERTKNLRAFASLLSFLRLFLALLFLVAEPGYWLILLLLSFSRTTWTGC
ncbi:MAG: hypothetical protein HC902_00425 [Calothrix sp. SM1_5_4]|nr:hypothetical protein [Calothrix sp. SM1_5_4]